MEHEGGNNSRAKSIPALTMQQYAQLMGVNVNGNGVVSNNNVSLAVPDPIPSGNVNGNPNPNVNPKTNNNEPLPPPPDASQPRAAAREQDQYLPVANVIRIMRRILPSHAKISDGAKETVQECVSEYIGFITGEANDRCRREQRRTVTAEDILWAMAKLGFDDYVRPLTVYLNRYRELESDRNVGSRDLPVAGKRRASEYPPLAPVVPGSAYNASWPLASCPMSPGMFFNQAPVGGGLSAPPEASNGGASGASTSGEQDNGGLMVSDFEEFAQFK